MATISLRVEKEGYYENNVVENIVDRKNFCYFDVDKNKIDITVFDNGIILHKESSGYELLLNLKDEAYCQISTTEGTIKLDAKVVAFTKNNDNIVVHYLIEDEERTIEIKY